MELYLHTCRITGKDPQEGHAAPGFESLQRPALIWHGAASSQGCSSKTTFLVDVKEA